jgi:hypothetical protein
LALEHFVLMEILAPVLHELRYGVHFWRTKTGYEVDSCSETARSRWR